MKVLPEPVCPYAMMHELYPSVAAHPISVDEAVQWQYRGRSLTQYSQYQWLHVEEHVGLCGINGPHAVKDERFPKLRFRVKAQQL